MEVYCCLPREYDVQYDADNQDVFVLPRKYVVYDGRGGHVEMDLDPFLSFAIGMIVTPSNRGRSFSIICYMARSW